MLFALLDCVGRKPKEKGDTAMKTKTNVKAGSVIWGT
jgi:hypothetical protein